MSSHLNNGVYTNVKIQVKRGLQANIDSVSLLAGELAFCYDTGFFYVGNPDGTKTLINEKHGFNWGDSITYNVGTDAGEIPVILSNGKLDTSIIPNMAISDVYVVSSEAEMLLLEATQGSLAIRTDVSKTYALASSDPTNVNDWIQLEFPGSAVNSVNGMNGDVTLDTSNIEVAGYTPYPNSELEGIENGSTLNEVLYEIDEELVEHEDAIQTLYGISTSLTNGLDSLDTRVTAIENFNVIDCGTF